MRWKTAVACTIFGQRYGAGASLNTESWTNEQLNYQLYMGHIVEDNDLGRPWVEAADGGTWSSAWDNHPYSGGVQATFQAPPSGLLLLIFTCQGNARASNAVVYYNQRVYTGGQIGGGQPAGNTGRLIFRGTALQEGETSTILSGMEPGATYNTYTNITTASSGGEMSLPRVRFIPLSD